MALVAYPLLYELVSLFLSSGIAAAQGHRGDVTVAVMHEKVIALPADGSGMEESLGLNETVIVAEAWGQTAFTPTTNRLLGFSSALRRWTDVRVDLAFRSQSTEWIEVK